MTIGNPQRDAMHDGPVLNLDEYAPYYIRAISNRLGLAASRLYSRKFGIGLTEWTCLSTLAKEQEVSASRICEKSGYDKGLVSRGLALLESKGLIESTPVKEHNRKRLIRLTPAGRSLYVEMESLALAREERLLEGLSVEDRMSMIGYMRIMLRNASELVDQDAVDGAAPAAMRSSG